MLLNVFDKNKLKKTIIKIVAIFSLFSILATGSFAQETVQPEPVGEFDIFAIDEMELDIGDEDADIQNSIVDELQDDIEISRDRDFEELNKREMLKLDDDSDMVFEDGVDLDEELQDELRDKADNLIINDPQKVVIIEDIAKDKIDSRYENTEVANEYKKLNSYLSLFINGFSDDVNKAGFLNKSENLDEFYNPEKGSDADDNFKSIMNESIKKVDSIFPDDDSENYGEVTSKNPDGNVVSNVPSNENDDFFDEENFTLPDLDPVESKNDGKKIVKKDDSNADLSAEQKQVKSDIDVSQIDDDFLDEGLDKDLESISKMDDKFRTNIIDRTKQITKCNDLADRLESCTEFSCKYENKDGLYEISLKKNDEGECEILALQSGDEVINCIVPDKNLRSASNQVGRVIKTSTKNEGIITKTISPYCQKKEDEKKDIIEVFADEQKESIKDEDVISLSSKSPDMTKSVPLPTKRPYTKPTIKVQNDYKQDSEKLPSSVKDTFERIIPSISRDFDARRTGRYSMSSKSNGNNNSSFNSNRDNEINFSSKKSLSQSSSIKNSLNNAYKALTTGQVSYAIKIYSSVLDIDPDNQKALFGLATSYHKNRQLTQARQVYAKILQNQPNNVQALNNFLVLVAEESPRAALAELQRLKGINRSYSPIHAQIAMINLKIGNLQEAESSLRKALILSPNNVTYKYNLAIIYDRLGKFDQSLSMYKQVLEAHRAGQNIPGSINSVIDRLKYLELQSLR